MNTFRKIELALFGLFFAFIIIQLYEIDVLGVLLILLLALDVFWIFTFIQSKKINSIGFGRKNLFEKLLLSFLLGSISLNISGVAYSSLLVKLGLLILAFYYLINGIAKWARQKQEWFNGLERIILALVLFGFFLRLMAYPGGGFLRVFPLTLLFMLMFAYSFVSMNRLKSEQHLPLGLSSMFIYWALTLGVVVILFDVMFWPGKVIFFSLYLILAVFATGFYLVRYFSTDRSVLSDVNRSLLYDTMRRIVIYNCICVFLVVLSRRQFERFQFGNRPQLIDAVMTYTTSTDEAESEAAWKEAQRLDSLYRINEYPEEFIK